MRIIYIPKASDVHDIVSHQDDDLASNIIDALRPSIGRPSVKIALMHSYSFPRRVSEYDPEGEMVLVEGEIREQWLRRCDRLKLEENELKAMVIPPSLLREMLATHSLVVLDPNDRVYALDVVWYMDIVADAFKKEMGIFPSTSSHDISSGSFGGKLIMLQSKATRILRLALRAAPVHFGVSFQISRLFRLIRGRQEDIGMGIHLPSVELVCIGAAHDENTARSLIRAARMERTALLQGLAQFWAKQPLYAKLRDDVTFHLCCYCELCARPVESPKYCGRCLSVVVCVCACVLFLPTLSRTSRANESLYVVRVH